MCELKWHLQNCINARRLLWSVPLAMYRPHCEKQRREMERMQAEESLYLPQDIDYLTLPVSLSQEVREILDSMRPSTVRPTPLNVKCVISVTVVEQDLNRSQVFNGHESCLKSRVYQ